MNKVFVGGLAWAVDDDGLREHFEQCGPVREARVIRERETGRSRGFGFVTFERAEDASQAKEQLNGSVHEGRTIRVESAQDQRR